MRPLVVAAFASLAALTPASAAVPAEIPVQGTLVDAQGAPLDGPHTVTLALYDALSAGAALHTETVDIDVDKGFFTAFLGSGAALDLEVFAQNPTLYLGIAVDDDQEMSPRLPIGSAPYAVEAGGVDWSRVRNVPPGLVDGEDADTTYDAGTGLILDGTRFRLDADVVEDLALGVCLPADYTPDWSELTGVPAGLADGDDNTTYSAGAGLLLTGSTFSADKPTIEGWVKSVAFDTEAELTSLLDDNYRKGLDKVPWTDLSDVPSGFADGVDNDTRYTAGTGLTLSGTTFSVDKATVETYARGVAFDTEGELTALLNDNYLGASYKPSWTDLAGRPTGLDDGDDVLSEAQVDAYVDNNGYALSSSLAKVGTSGAFADLSGVPTGLADGDDDTLAALGCKDGDRIKRVSGKWACETPTPIETFSCVPSAWDYTSDRIMCSTSITLAEESLVVVSMNGHWRTNTDSNWCIGEILFPGESRYSGSGSPYAAKNGLHMYHSNWQAFSQTRSKILAAGTHTISYAVTGSSVCYMNGSSMHGHWIPRR